MVHCSPVAARFLAQHAGLAALAARLNLSCQYAFLFPLGQACHILSLETAGESKGFYV